MRLPFAGTAEAEQQLAATNAATWRLLDECRLDPARPASGSYQRVTDRKVSTTDADAAPMSKGGVAKLSYHTRVHVYQAPAVACQACPVRTQCTDSQQGRKLGRSFDEVYLKRWLTRTGWGRRHGPCGSLALARPPSARRGGAQGYEPLRP